jgi:hypothetical protein
MVFYYLRKIGIFTQVDMLHYTTSPTPLSSTNKLSLIDGTLVGLRIHSLHMYRWRTTVTYPHLCSSGKKNLRYVRSTLKFGLTFQKSSSTLLSGFSKAGCAGYPDNKCSTECFAIFCGSKFTSRVL